MDAVTKKTKFKEKLINDINDDDMMTKIIRALTTIKKTNEITIEAGGSFHLGKNIRGAKSPKSANRSNQKKKKNQNLML